MKTEVDHVGQAKWRNVHNRIRTMPPMTVISIEHACPMVNGTHSCNLHGVIFGAGERGYYNVKCFHDGNDLYVVKMPATEVAE